MTISKLNATNMTEQEVAAWEDLARSGKLRYALATENERAYQVDLARHVARLFRPPQAVVVAQERPRRHPLVVKYRKREENAVAATTQARDPNAHVHRWRCESPNNGEVAAHCAGCGADRAFPACPKGLDWGGD